MTAASDPRTPDATRGERCGECRHRARKHDEDGCLKCDCGLTPDEAVSGRDEEMDDAISQALWENAVTNDEPWTREARDE